LFSLPYKERNLISSDDLSRINRIDDEELIKHAPLKTIKTFRSEAKEIMNLIKWIMRFGPRCHDSSLNQWITGLGGDTTSVVLVTGHLDESFVSP